MKDRIKLIMEKAGLSQQEFAAKLGISAASLSSIFTGRTNPTNNHVMAIHKAFPQINVNWLMFGEGDICMGEDAFSANDGSEKEESSSLAEEEKKEDASHPSLNTQQTVRSLFDEETSAPTSQAAISSPTYSGRKDMRTTVRGNGQVVTTNIVAEREDRKIKEIRVFYSNGTYESFVPSNK